MKHEFWTIAYRKRYKEKNLLNNKCDEFFVIPNTWRYWCADPHLIEYKGKHYVFAELYDRVIRRGVIGYCEITDNSYTSWKIVLKMPYHLSYPHILSDGKDIYMIPESYAGNEIAVFKSIAFPDRWEKVHVIKKKYVVVDSTVISVFDNTFVFTYEIENNKEDLVILSLSKTGEVQSTYTVCKGDSNKRPAGNFFWNNKKLIRPAQDCSVGYGCALNFFEVQELKKNRYVERLVEKIKPEDIKSNYNGKPEGIHTYNMNDKYEVIDLKSYEFDWLYYLTRPIWFVWRRIRKGLRK